MSDLRNQLHAAKQTHLAMRYPGDLAAEVLSPRRHLRPLLWIGPLVAAAAVVAMVFWIRTTPIAPVIPDNTQFAQITDSDEADEMVFAVSEVPNMQEDLGISPTDIEADETFPSFSDVSSPEMPSMPSFDFSSTDNS